MPGSCVGLMRKAAEAGSKDKGLDIREAAAKLAAVCESNQVPEVRSKHRHCLGPGRMWYTSRIKYVKVLKINFVMHDGDKTHVFGASGSRTSARQMALGPRLQQHTGCWAAAL